MASKTLGIILNGATGRIGSTQHLQNALVPIRDGGGLPVGEDQILPRVLLVGRNAEKLAAIAKTYRIDEWTTDLASALAEPAFDVFFDAAATEQRTETLAKAIAGGKHIYTEKPVALSVAAGLKLLHAAAARGVKHGAVEDKIYLPGLRKLARLIDTGFFGCIVSFRLEFGWWVFDGTTEACQRPSWNYRRAGGGGLILDMYPHWRYVIEGILGRILRVVCVASTATPERIDERGQRYNVDVEDTTAALVELANGISGTVLSSWATRVRRDDLFVLQVDGVEGSAVAGLHRCWTQTKEETPVIRSINPTVDIGADYLAQWSEVPDTGLYPNSYRVGWENFICHVVGGAPLRSDLKAGIRDLQLADCCYRSAIEKRWIALEERTV
jgi:predicted dehydrogenase